MWAQRSRGNGQRGFASHLAVGFPGRCVLVVYWVFCSHYPVCFDVPSSDGWTPVCVRPLSLKALVVDHGLQPPLVTRVCCRLFICSSIPLIWSLGVDRKKIPRYLNIVCVLPLFTLLLGFLTRAPFVVAGNVESCKVLRVQARRRTIRGILRKRDPCRLARPEAV